MIGHNTKGLQLEKSPITSEIIVPDSLDHLSMEQCSPGRMVKISIHPILSNPFGTTASIKSLEIVVQTLLGPKRDELVASLLIEMG
jgi:hypothetical protein